ncbi:MAG TPA: hypothetical protein VFI02_16790 [Armatimonadota bacterium]|nr:hypothetical protein [Armatimonadota bacterium]
MTTVKMCAYIVMLVAAICCQAQEANTVAPKTLSDIILQEVLPSEFGQFQALAKEGYNRATADAALALVKAAHEILREQQTNKEEFSAAERQKGASAYTFAWEQAIKTWQKTQDSAARSAILALWDSSLKENNDERRVQILALVGPWERAFLSQAFIQLFGQTKDAMILHAMCKVLGQHGELAEKALLHEKRESLSEVMNPQTAEYATILSNIDDALKRIEYWEKGDYARAGPAKGGPAGDGD